VKTLLLALAFLVPGFAVAQSATPELTATQLARHLGIYHWQIAKEELPVKYNVRVQEIRDGKLPIGVIDHFATLTRKQGNLVIAMSQEEEEWKVSFFAEDGNGGSLRARIKVQSLGMAPRKVIIGKPMVLRGQYREQEGRIVISGKVEDVVSGFAVTISEAR